MNMPLFSQNAPVDFQSDDYYRFKFNINMLLESAGRSEKFPKRTDATASGPVAQ